MLPAADLFFQPEGGQTDIKKGPEDGLEKLDYRKWQQEQQDIFNDKAWFIKHNFQNDLNIADPDANVVSP